MMRTLMKTLLLLVAIVVTAVPADAVVRVRYNMGGLMTSFEADLSNMRWRGEKFVIDGPCYSACTMALGALPRDQVCVTPRAVLGFHSAWNFDLSGRRVTNYVATQELRNTYPPEINRWIDLHGGLEPRLKTLRGKALAALVPRCPPQILQSGRVVPYDTSFPSPRKHVRTMVRARH